LKMYLFHHYPQVFEFGTALQPFKSLYTNLQRTQKHVV